MTDPASSPPLSFDEMLNAMPGAVFQYIIQADGASEIAYASSRFFEIYDVTPEQVRSDTQCVWRAVHPDDIEILLASNAQIDKLLPSAIEYRIRRNDGERWLSCVSVPLPKQKCQKRNTALRMPCLPPKLLWLKGSSPVVGQP